MGNTTRSPAWASIAPRSQP
ncbi:rCG63073 [Rattus norvegicus]|uniref:RCG63073 n=1 Tax=Rattus norvegicus TaxID=10116 RepID=A6KPH9_RAT|nr:rCG63073 [Rattus norvegicus]